MGIGFTNCEGGEDKVVEHDIVSCAWIPIFFLFFI